MTVFQSPVSLSINNLDGLVFKTDNQDPIADPIDALLHGAKLFPMTATPDISVTFSDTTTSVDDDTGIAKIVFNVPALLLELDKTKVFNLGVAGETRTLTEEADSTHQGNPPVVAGDDMTSVPQLGVAHNMLRYAYTHASAGAGSEVSYHDIAVAFTDDSINGTGKFVEQVDADTTTQLQALLYPSDTTNMAGYTVTNYVIYGKYTVGDGSPAIQYYATDPSGDGAVERPVGTHGSDTQKLLLNMFLHHDTLDTNFDSGAYASQAFNSGETDGFEYSINDTGKTRNMMVTVNPHMTDAFQPNACPFGVNIHF
jgi:hypothetical protein